MKKIALISLVALFAVDTAGGATITATSATVGANDHQIVSSKWYVDYLHNPVIVDLNALNAAKSELQGAGTADEIATVDATGQYVRSGTTLQSITNNKITSGKITGTHVTGTGTVSGGELTFNDVQLDFTNTCADAMAAAGTTPANSHCTVSISNDGASLYYEVVIH